MPFFDCIRDGMLPYLCIEIERDWAHSTIFYFQIDIFMDWQWSRINLGQTRPPWFIAALKRRLDG
jgi:hypothetical protein